MLRFKYLDKNKINALPKTTGVYVFKKGRDFLYIGKAANIRQRVKNHFQQQGFKDNLFIQETDKIGYIKTDSEIEALLLEAALIKKLQPKYNVMWKDDKNYFYVVITKQDFPRISVTHQCSEVGLQNIGPFVDGGALKQTLRVLRRVFPYRTCKTMPKRPCLWHELGQCPAPCKKTYRNFAVASGDSPEGSILIFQKGYNKNIKNLTKVLRGKKMQVLRGLKKEMRELSKVQEFEKAARVRDQIMALENVFQHSHILQELPKKEKPDWPKTEKQLQRILGLRKRIKRIEGYDVSNIQGKQATGSMIVFEQGEPNPQEYRKFKIKIAGKPNDIAMLKEVLARRFQHPEWPYPQVMLIDGGRAQLNVAIKTKNDILKFRNIKVMALVKKKNQLYIEKKDKPLLLRNLPQEVSNLILHLRDEAHRFAFSYHRLLRKKTFLRESKTSRRGRVKSREFSAKRKLPTEERISSRGGNIETEGF